MKRRLRDPVLPTDFADRRSRGRLLKHADDLLFGEPLPSHESSRPKASCGLTTYELLPLLGRTSRPIRSARGARAIPKSACQLQRSLESRRWKLTGRPSPSRTVAAHAWHRDGTSV